MVSHFTNLNAVSNTRQKHDNVKLEDSKEGIAWYPESSSTTPEEKVKLEDGVYSSSLAVPLQKGRRLKVEVVVPTLDLLRRQTTREAGGDDYVKILKKMKNVGALYTFSDLSQ